MVMLRSRDKVIFGVAFGIWLVFAYWLYSGRIYPALHPAEVTTSRVTDETIAEPIVFNWAEDVPITGISFDQLLISSNATDSLDQFVVLNGSYFLDERNSVAAGDSLAKERIRKVKALLSLKSDRCIKIITRAEMDGDVKGKTFVAVDVRIIDASLLFTSTDSICQICFPDQNVDRLPVGLQQRVLKWMKSGVQPLSLELEGSADGTHIAESSERAADRAIAIRNLIEKGIGPLHIDISTQQSNLTEPILNRCVRIEKIINVE